MSRNNLTDEEKRLIYLEERMKILEQENKQLQKEKDDKSYQDWIDSMERH